MYIQFENRQRKYETTGLVALFETLASHTLATEPFALLLSRQQLEASVTVSFVSAAAIRKINQENRAIDKITDVLSFPMLELLDGHLQLPLTDADYDYTSGEPAVFLGDIVICLQRAEQQAVAYGHSFYREAGFLFVHGLLHVLGYDHDTPDREAIMLQKQRLILDQAGLSR